MRYRMTVLAALTLIFGLGEIRPARAVDLAWVTVGDPNNVADSTGYGAVAESFRIMQFEWTNAEYVDFLNAIDPQGTNPNDVYNASMGSDIRGGISFDNGAANGSKYAVRTNMGDKPVNYVNWFDSVRVANWLHNGAQNYASSDASASAPQNTGAYTVGTATSGNAVARNVGALYWLPTENEWYKAAYYKGGGTNAGYWDYATQSDTAPTPVSADSTGNGSAGATGNFANFFYVADWNGQDGNVTTVGTNGGASAYLTYDMTGNNMEINDLSGNGGVTVGQRGGSWGAATSSMGSSFRSDSLATTTEVNFRGFRLAAVVPEPSTYILGGLATGLMTILARRRKGKSSRGRESTGAIAK